MTFTFQTIIIHHYHSFAKHTRLLDSSAVTHLADSPACWHWSRGSRQPRPLPLGGGDDPRRTELWAQQHTIESASVITAGLIVCVTAWQKKKGKGGNHALQRKWEALITWRRQTAGTSGSVTTFKFRPTFYWFRGGKYTVYLIEFFCQYTEETLKDISQVAKAMNLFHCLSFNIH